MLGFISKQRFKKQKLAVRCFTSIHARRKPRGGFKLKDHGAIFKDHIIIKIH